VDSAVRDSFPASDPPAPTASQGIRAASPGSMADEAPLAPPLDAARLSRAFPDAETAKLALESLVREAPIDRRCAEILPHGQDRGAVLMLTLPREEQPRVEALLDRLTEGQQRA
jgi:hypothetical protein